MSREERREGEREKERERDRPVPGMVQQHLECRVRE